MSSAHQSSRPCTRSGMLDKSLVPCPFGDAVALMLFLLVHLCRVRVLQPSVPRVLAARLWMPVAPALVVAVLSALQTANPRPRLHLLPPTAQTVTRHPRQGGLRARTKGGAFSAGAHSATTAAGGARCHLSWCAGVQNSYRVAFPLLGPFDAMRDSPCVLTRQFWIDLLQAPFLPRWRGSEFITIICVVFIHRCIRVTRAKVLIVQGPQQLTLAASFSGPSSS
jgi:hypothetical protein